MPELRACEVKRGNTWQKGLRFHCWGYESEEGSNGNPSTMWSVGIVEEPDGLIIGVSPGYIRFTDRNTTDGKEKTNG